jgi:hypothetical protein
MTTWSKDELRKIAEADDLHISPFREDGVTYGTPTWIWSVAVGDALYARAYNGRNSRWYQAAVRQRAGRITAAGMTKEVTFEPVEGPINDLIAARDQCLIAEQLPDGVDSFAAAALGCRYMTAYWAVVDRGRVQPGQWLAVHGCGPSASRRTWK